MEGDFTFYIEKKFIHSPCTEVVSFQGYDYIPHKFCFEESEDPGLTDSLFYLEENKNLYIQCCNESCFLLHEWNEKDQSSKFISEFQDLEECMKNTVILNDYYKQKLI